MAWNEWSLFIGVLLVTMVLAGSLLERLPLSSAMVYLALGWFLGPSVAGALQGAPGENIALLQRATEVALLIALFAVGMQLGVPLRDRRWRLPLRLAFVSMAAMVAMVTAVGVWLLHLPLGAAVLLGGILAPTDPVLASGVPSEQGSRPDRLGFSLAGEGGLNDGSAFPLVMLGLGLLGLHDLGPNGLRWWVVDLVWATLGGIAIGAVLGTAIGQIVVYLRSRHDEALGLDEFLALGLVAMAYGLAQMCSASGFLAVFAAGLALQRVRQQPRTGHAGIPPHAIAPFDIGAALPSDHAADMRDSVKSFNEQLEKLVELIAVLIVGAMLANTPPVAALLWFVPLVLIVLRPLAVAVSLPGEDLTQPQRAMLAWFGIRGIGSVFYLLLALRQGLPADLADTLQSLTLWTVAVSIVVHGITAQPLMRQYRSWRRRRRSAR